MQINIEIPDDIVNYHTTTNQYLNLKLFVNNNPYQSGQISKVEYTSPDRETQRNLKFHDISTDVLDVINKMNRSNQMNQESMKRYYRRYRNNLLYD